MVKSAHTEESGNSRDSVLVGCNIPNGFVMKCFAETEVEVLVLGGGKRFEKQYRADPQWPEVKLSGPAVPWGTHPTYDIKSGYAFTTVSKKFWDRWAPWNKDLLASKSIICGDDQDAAFSLAKDYKNCKSGLQPLRQKKDLRVKIATRPEVVVSEDSEVLAD
jgi:hypothetical protein